MTRPLLLLLALVTLSACSARDLCISRATQDLRVMEGLIAETRATIARGYAIEERTVPAEELRICHDSEGKERPCWVTVPRLERKPVSVDLAAERRKLDSMRAKRDALAREAEAAMRACRAAYPES
ncbi:MAG: hypothetical protein ACLFRU_10730 [Paracoccaceae bacterium]